MARAGMRKIGRLGWLAALMVGPLVWRGSGQGTQADYDRALGLAKATENRVFRDRVKPHWLPDGARFWYKVSTGPGTHEFVFVDANRRERRPAFDHARLAEALGRSTGGTLAADRLPLEDLEFSPDDNRLVFRASGKRWTCALGTYELTPAAEAAGAASSLPATLEPHPSRRTGEETTLRFRNESGGEVQLFWINTEGERQRYATLASGAEHRQHTFSGHVWLATDAAGKVLGVFEAGDDGGDAVIKAGSAVRTAPRERPSRRERNPGDSPRSESPDGRWIAFVRDHNLRVRNLGNGEETVLTSDGNAEDAYSDRLHWSPDSTRLVAIREKPGDDRKINMIESSPRDQLQPRLHTLAYAKPGDRMPVARPQLFDVPGERQIPVADALFTNAWSISEVRWWPDSSRFTFVYNRRGHQLLRVISVDSRSGEARAIVEESSPTFVEYAGKYFQQPVDGAQELVWMSERDGWNHLYLYDAAAGRVKNQITRGEWVVRDVERVDENARQIWFRAGGIRPGQDPYHIHLARVDFDGSHLTVLTEGDGTHDVEFSPDRRWLLDRWSRVDQPPVTELRQAEDGALVVGLERAEADSLAKAGWRAPERFVAKGRDGTTDIYGVIFRPSGFVPGQRYPVIEEIYAGPQGAFVPKAFGLQLRQHAIAELGFIVVQIDGMGTSYRSKAFHDVCWKNLGDSGFPDRIAWLKAAAATRPEMDLSRVGIYGGSAGGQSALRALLAHGDFYKVAVADCGCHDNRMDKIWWNELWMGWPLGPHYEEQSNVTQAHRLQGKLLLTVGELDRNVDPASTMQVVNALIKANKDFDLLVVPGANHGIGESPYASRRRMDFFVRHLLGVEPRAK